MKIKFDKRNGNQLTKVDLQQLATIYNIFGENLIVVNWQSVTRETVSNIMGALYSAIGETIDKSEYKDYLIELFVYFQDMCKPKKI